MPGCRACQKKKEKKKKHHHKKKKSSSSSSDKKDKGILCACCDQCLCYKYGGRENWYCKCGCNNCKCGFKVVKALQKVKK